MSNPDEDGESDPESLGTASRRLQRPEVPDSDALLDYEPLRDRKTPEAREPDPSSETQSNAGGTWDPGGGTDDGAGVDDIEADRLFDVLADERRRIALHYLRDRGGAAPFEDVVDAVTDRAKDDDAGDRRAVESALYHVHLPKLHDVGLLTENDSDGEVRLSSRVASLPLWLLEAR